MVLEAKYAGATFSWKNGQIPHSEEIKGHDLAQFIPPLLYLNIWKVSQENVKRITKNPFASARVDIKRENIW